MASRNWSDTLMAEKNDRRDNGKKAESVLMMFRDYYNSMDWLRDEYYRCKRFVAGDQWGDKTTFCGCEMTEREVLERQGRYAVTNNFLKILVRNYKGTYIKQDLEAVCMARAGESQMVADALSTALQYNWDINSQKELNAAVFDDGLQSACFVAKVSVGVMDNRYDVWSEFVDFPHFVVDSNMKDPRGIDAECVGQIHDMKLPRLLSAFAKSAADRQRISKIYGECKRRTDICHYYDRFGKIDESDDFMFPKDFALCRVYEIWTKEFRDGYWCHDYLNGDLYSCSKEEKEEIDSINEARMQQARAAGVSESDIETARILAGDPNADLEMPEGCKLIQAKYFYEDYWYYRFLAPTGDVIAEGESMYAHKSHPYVFRFYPMLGGDARSFINDVIDLQKDINRMDTMYDWIMRHSAKGALLMPKDQMDEEDGWTLQRYGQAWAQPDAVIPYLPKAGYSIPQQISKNNTDIGITQMIATKTQWIQDITGVQGTLQGKRAVAGTSGALYAQQAENATTSLLDLLNVFSGWTKELAMKQVKCMQQIYDSKRWAKICGENYGIDFNYDDIVNADTQVRIIESASSPVYRATINDELKWMIQLGLIDRDTYLNNTTLPFGNKLRMDIQAAEDAALAAGQMPLPSSVPQQASQASVAGANAPQAGANNMYNQMAKNG